jgi:fructose-1,6-bisphosphatase/inositol monophosphatase family enzyme
VNEPADAADRIDAESVCACLRAVAREEILPFFRALEPHQIREKEPGDLVTIVDERVEQVLTEALPKLLPGSTVVGEEAVAAEPGVIERLAGHAPVWVIDPIDGTRNFAAGREPFGVMVALIDRGRTCAAWIFDPVADRMAWAAAGRGTHLDGARVSLQQAPASVAKLEGRAVKNALAGAPEALAGWSERRKRFGRTFSNFCAAAEYLMALEGKADFLVYRRTKPWDHAPGVFLYQQAGGVAARFDGEPYRLDDWEGGLILAPDPATWERVRATLFDPL